MDPESDAIGQDVRLNGQQAPGDPDLVLIPLHRDAVTRMKCVKFSEAELERLEKLQEWCYTTVNPETGRAFIPRNEFSCLMQLCLNLAFQAMAGLAQQMAQADGG